MNIRIEMKAAAVAPGGPRPVRYAVMVEEGVANLPPVPRLLPAWPALSVPIDVAPPGEPTAVARAHPAMADLVRQTLRLTIPDTIQWQLRRLTVPADAVEVRPSGYVDAGRSLEELRLPFDRNSPTPWPLPVAWSVWVRIGGREHLAGTITFPARAGRFGTTPSLEPPDGRETFDGIDRVDVILRPDAETAERTVHLTDFWDGEVTFNDVPVMRDPQHEASRERTRARRREAAK